MSLRAGVGRAVIDTPLPASLAGFIEPQPATEVHDPLEVRALLLDDAGVTVCLVVCDLLGMSQRYSAPARAAVGEVLGLPAEAVLVACTHTHAAPSAMEGTAALGWETPQGFADLIADACRTAAVSAHDALQPAVASFGRFPLPSGLSLNRRGHPYDPWFSLVELHRPDGGAVATLANLAVHPVALGPECLAVSADWVGPFRIALDDALGGSSVMVSGALGDVNPGHVHRQDNDCRVDGFAEADRLGRDLADVVAGVAGRTDTVDGGLRVVSRRTIHVPVGGTRLAALVGSSAEIELVEWALGPVRIVSVPGEAFHALGHEIDASREHRVVLAGLAPVWQGYLPVPYVAGGYEEATSYGPAAVDAIRAALLDVPA